MSFKVKRKDGRPQWRVIYDHVCDWAPNDTLSYRDGLKLLDTGNRALLHQAVGRCNIELLKSRQRQLGNIKNTGYRIIAAAEHIEYVHRDERRAKRAITKASRVGTNVQWGELTNEQRDELLAKNSVLAIKQDILKANDARIKRWDNLRSSL